MERGGNSHNVMNNNALIPIGKRDRAEGLPCVRGRTQSSEKMHLQFLSKAGSTDCLDGVVDGKAHIHHENGV